MILKKILVLFIMSFLFVVASAQSKQTVVKLKNGTEIKGIVKSIDPSDAIILVIAGVETKIRVADVARIEEESEMDVYDEPLRLKFKNDEKLIVTDNGEYPDSIVIEIGDTKINMILVRGGDMNFGYDGPGSLDMESEPVHRVGITSFYISEHFIPYNLAQKYSEKRVKHVGPFFCGNWNACNALAKTIAQESGIPVRLPTEAEWEYAACSDKQNVIFSNCFTNEYCYDYYASFTVSSYVKDPTGPINGKNHVVRHYNGKKNMKFQRISSFFTQFMRIAVKANEVIKKL